MRALAPKISLEKARPLPRLPGQDVSLIESRGRTASPHLAAKPARRSVQHVLEQLEEHAGIAVAIASATVERFGALAPTR